MIIYVEGVDGTGKTTLVNTLYNDYGYRRLECVKRNNNKEKEYSNWESMLDNLDCEFTYIVDRSFITELVYRLHDDDETFLTLRRFVILLQKQPCKIIHCDTEQSYKLSMERGEDNITSKELHNEIKNTYSVVMNLIRRFTNTQIMKYDINGNGPMDTIKFINK